MDSAEWEGEQTAFESQMHKQRKQMDVYEIKYKTLAVLTVLFERLKHCFCRTHLQMPSVDTKETVVTKSACCSTK